jgi:plastocyanin
MFNFKKITVWAIAAFVFTLFSAQEMAAQTTEKNVTIIELVQTPGVFNTQELNLKPGKYQFRIVNQNVDHDLGFVIQKATDTGKDVTKFHVANSFTTKTVKAGEAAYTGVIDLTKGNYTYVCPLNPTPHYKIKVK